MRADVATRPGIRDNTEWTPARIFMAVSAVWHLLLGVIGLIYDQTFPIGADAATGAASDHILGVFETNGWHSLAGVVLGLVSTYFWLRPQRARDAALVIGVFHVGLVLALEAWSPETFWLASNTADQVVHSSTAIAGIVTGLMTRSPRSGS